MPSDGWIVECGWLPPAGPVVKTSAARASDARHAIEQASTQTVRKNDVNTPEPSARNSNQPRRLPRKKKEAENGPFVRLATFRPPRPPRRMSGFAASPDISCGKG